MNAPGDRAMDDDTARAAWAGGLLKAMDARFDQVGARADAIAAQLDRQADIIIEAIEQADKAARWRRGGNRQPGLPPAPGDEP